MKVISRILFLLVIAITPVLVNAQKKKKNEPPPPPPVDSVALKAAADSVAAVAYADSVAKKAKADSIAAVAVADSIRKTDSVAKAKDCYLQWYETMRSRGAKPVPDGMQQVVLALKGEQGVHCFLGQIEVAGGKVKPPLFVQQENGEYREIRLLGKKLEPGFVTAMGEDQLYTISEGMSIVFRTTDNEYGRLFFYKYVNKSAQSNKEAPSPADLIKD